MKLLWSPFSPYVRKVLIIAHGLGVADQIELERVKIGMALTNDEVMRHNPLSKIPTLVLDHETALFDSFVICEYFATQAGLTSLVPGEGALRWEILRRHAVANGLCDLSILLFNERLRDEHAQSMGLLTALPAKRAAALEELNHSPPPVDQTALDAATTAAALAFLDLRFAEVDWRRDCPALADWSAAFADLPAVRAVQAIIKAAES